MKYINFKLLLVALISLFLLNACTKCSSSNLEKEEINVDDINNQVGDSAEKNNSDDSAKIGPDADEVVEPNDRIEEPVKGESEPPPNDFESSEPEDYPPSADDEELPPTSEDSSSYGEGYEDDSADEEYD